jgi:hypothetical protein
MTLRREDKAGKIKLLYILRVVNISLNTSLYKSTSIKQYTTHSCRHIGNQVKSFPSQVLTKNRFDQFCFKGGAR